MKDNKFNIGNTVRIKGTFFTAKIVDLFPQKHTEYYLKTQEGIKKFYEHELDYTVFAKAIMLAKRTHIKLLIIRRKIEQTIVNYDSRRNDLHRTAKDCQ